MKGRTSDLPALMLCNWAIETLQCAKASCAEEENDEIVSPVVKWKRMFSASRVTSVERRKKLTPTKLSSLLILKVCGMCVTYELSKNLTKLTVSVGGPVIERLSSAWPEDLTNELSNYYFLTLRASLELQMIEK